MSDRPLSDHEIVQAQLRAAGFEVRAGMLHGLWHMVAELDEDDADAFDGERCVAISGTNPGSVAACLWTACAGERADRGASLVEIGA